MSKLVKLKEQVLVKYGSLVIRKDIEDKRIYVHRLFKIALIII